VLSRLLDDGDGQARGAGREVPRALGHASIVAGVCPSVIRRAPWIVASQLARRVAGRGERPATAGYRRSAAGTGPVCAARRRPSPRTARGPSSSAVRSR
jgi:hypothetical protein